MGKDNPAFSYEGKAIDKVALEKGHVPVEVFCSFIEQQWTPEVLPGRIPLYQIPPSLLFWTEAGHPQIAFTSSKAWLVS